MRYLIPFLLAASAAAHDPEDPAHYPAWLVGTGKGVLVCTRDPEGIQRCSPITRPFVICTETEKRITCSNKET